MKRFWTIVLVVITTVMAPVMTVIAPNMASAQDDLCPNPNPSPGPTPTPLPDTDGDGTPDLCDTDNDNDGQPDTLDNCLGLANPGQENADQDAQGDACDPDDDNDGTLDAADNCPTTANADQADQNGNGIGDACETAATPTPTPTPTPVPAPTPVPDEPAETNQPVAQPTVPAQPARVASARGSALPTTGTDPTDVFGLGIACLLVGVPLLKLTRRRRRPVIYRNATMITAPPKPAAHAEQVVGPQTAVQPTESQSRTCTSEADLLLPYWH